MKNSVSETLPIVNTEYVLYTRRKSNNKKIIITSLLGLLLVVGCSVALYRFHYDPSSSDSIATSDNKDCPVQSFDYLLYVVRWAPSVCLEGPCVDNYPKDWLIHGLWPNFWDGSWPQFCCKSDEFDVNKVKSLEPQLESKWSNLLPGKSASSLWAHEWDKHGTCSSENKQLVGEMGYFGSTLSFYDKFAFKNWLLEAGIQPSDTTVLQESRVINALAKYIPNTIELHCEKAKGGNVPYLDSISICIDKTSLSPIDCPKPKDTCKSGLILPKGQ